jgi:hypothetical protein
MLRTVGSMAQQGAHRGRAPRIFDDGLHKDLVHPLIEGLGDMILIVDGPDAFANTPRHA